MTSSITIMFFSCHLQSLMLQRKTESRLILSLYEPFVCVFETLTSTEVKEMRKLFLFHIILKINLFLYHFSIMVV